MKMIFSNLRNPALLTFALIILWADTGSAQLTGWQYQAYRYDGGQPGALLISSATGAEVILRPGDELSGYRVLAVNVDRVLFRKGEAVETLLLTGDAKAAASSAMDLPIDQLRAQKKQVRDVLRDLCERAGLQLEIEGDIRGTVSVDFSNMTVREILNTLCRHSSLEYQRELTTLRVSPQGQLKKREK